MDCRTFRELLPDFLGGDAPDGLFDELVEHEASCAECAEAAAAAMGAPGAALSRTLPPPGAATAPGAEWLASTLDRTVGTNCGYIRMRLAEGVDAPIAPDSARRVEQHLTGCAACRALAVVMRALPAYYDALDRLRADDTFAREILARTMPARPGLLVVLRALVRRPEALWEGAAVCALLAVPLAGPSMSACIQSARQAGDRVEQRIAEADLAGPLAQPFSNAGEGIGQAITSGRKTIVDGLSRTRARVEEFIHTEMEKRVASDPRMAVVAPAIEDVLDRIGLIEAERSAAGGETTPPAGAGQTPPPVEAGRTIPPAEADKTVAPEPPSDGGTTP